jgi:hypothetical protein
LAVGLVMPVTWMYGAISRWNANAASSAVFQVATPPDSTPHAGSAALNSFGYSWIRPAVIMPPSDSPHATVCRGALYVLPKAATVAAWSGMACWTDQPVVEYDDPASA